ncbi:DUF4232 domain-containing protein [Agrococcus sp. SGAir0287]|uniref:DUF4232 domain-containing protein n=1 Tax=Agrococcus sp. SGAir0287 TaxID=2070347 RepID=UPI001586481B|nr:DUF4232 domain-containing protein [Agrococcus sp. SGAir0287]
MSASRKPLIVAVVAASLLLTACGAPAEPPTEGQSPPPSAPTEGSASPSPADPETAGEDAPCAAGDLDVTAAIGDAGAGSVTVTFTFENVGGTPCTLDGFPGVSAVGDGNGTQIGQPAERSDRSYEPVIIASGDTATAALRMVDVAGGGGPLGDACQVQPADGWRIYPPGSTEAIFVPVDGLSACAGDVDWITIDPVVG